MSRSSEGNVSYLGDTMVTNRHLDSLECTFGEGVRFALAVPPCLCMALGEFCNHLWSCA